MGSITRPGVTLEDRWEAKGEVTLLTGIQALVHVPLMQHALDAARGWNTGGYISGYRGSPLGVFDKELSKQAKRLAAARGRGRRARVCILRVSSARRPAPSWTVRRAG